MLTLTLTLLNNNKMIIMIMMMMIWTKIMMIMTEYVDARFDSRDSTHPTTRDDWQTHSSQRRDGGLAF